MGGITVMGVVTSMIEADEAVTSPTMISCKHPQGGPRPPDAPLQELTQELLSGTKQVMLWGHRALLCGGRSTLQSLYPTILWFEAIFNQRFNAAHTIVKEPMWHHVSELQANFKVPTYEVVGGTLAPVDKECMGNCPKMFLFTLDELSHMNQHIDNTDV